MEPVLNEPAAPSATASERAPLLEIRDLEVGFETAAGELVPAVRGVNLEVRQGEILGLVGESGSGKSVTCLSVLRLLPGGAVVTGGISFGGADVLGMDGPELRRFRATQARVVFQDPASSLNPLMRVGDQLVESVRMSRSVSAEGARREAVEMFERVGIAEPRRRFDAYPHEMSGGMQQRVMIAMALAASPKLLICDEPTTALDVTTEGQILELLRDLNQAYGTSIIFTTHDLGLVRELCHRVAVMYAGRVVETAGAQGCLQDPRHPYTTMLLSAEPESAPAEARRLRVISGSPPRPTDRISGCAFHPRCPLAESICTEEVPALSEMPGAAEHWAACWMAAEGRQLDG